jgi:hypothetical protein
MKKCNDCCERCHQCLNNNLDKEIQSFIEEDLTKDSSCFSPCSLTEYPILLTMPVRVKINREK